jgi:hypothetical protein
MRGLERRIKRLEGTREEASQLLIYFLMNAGAEFPLSQGECLATLSEAGFRPGCRICVLNLLDVPCDLSTTQAEGYLREHAAEVCQGGWTKTDAMTDNGGLTTGRVRQKTYR